MQRASFRLRSRLGYQLSLLALAFAFSAAWTSESEAQIIVAPTFNYTPVTPYAVPYYPNGYQAYYGNPYQSRAYYPNYRYPSYRYPAYRAPRVRVYQTPSTSSTWGGAHSSQYFGNAHGSQYFPR
ncbi:hypothetical protein [Planctomycetes bacterium K23_9]|uniref:Uncharacterized protein n=1 Tax=Stieleria marina TaxID=1930275 RepID=A0A517NMQ7_9BACT|nr:hypothetical protein K239x_03470 [Planctomycetes bacterium K23_9]